MARTGITRDQVFEEADTLADEGIQPTVKLVRERIGGSYSTITPHLAAWKNERGGKAVANVPDMPESVVAASRSVWVAAWKGAEDLIQTERDGLTAARREMESERAEMASEITELEGKLDTVTGERDTLTRSLGPMRGSSTKERRKRSTDCASRTPALRSGSRTPTSVPRSCASRSSAWRENSLDSQR